VNLPPKKVTYTSNAYADPLGTAIQEAEAGDTLQVIGTCHGNYVITKDLTIRGRASANHADTIDGGVKGMVLLVPPTATDVHLAVSNLTITNGSVGGIGAYTGVVTVSDSHVTKTAGTGIGQFGRATVSVDSSLITDNHAIGGGGGIWDSLGTMTITNSTISGNTAGGNGGGIFNRGHLTVLNSVIEGNISSGNGGGIYVLSGTVNITDSTVTGNTAMLGGPVFDNTGSAVTLNGTSNLCGNTPDDWPGCGP
jgi:hypothetical protein